MARGGKRTRSPAPEPTFELDAAEIDDEIEILWTDQVWYRAVVLDSRKEDGEPCWLRFRYVGHSCKSRGAWIQVSEPTVRFVTTAANAEAHHVGNFEHNTGHLEEDAWEVEEILDERVVGGQTEYRIRWHGWSAQHDTWEPDASVLDRSLVAAFEEKRDAARLAAEQAERDERASYAGEAITLLRKRLVKKLQKQERSAKFQTVAGLDLCEMWKLKAIREFLVSLLAEGDDAADHITEIEPTRGASGRGKIVEHQFFVHSHRLVGLFVDVDVGASEPLREQHVVLRPQGNGTAVALLPSLKFIRRGPRSQPDQMKLTVKAGFGTLNAQSRGEPYWAFNADICVCTEEEMDDDEWECPCESNHYGAIARRVVNIAQREKVDKGMVRLCKRLASRV